MKGMKLIAAITALTQLWTLALPALSWGGTDNTFNPNAVNTSALKAVDVNCDNFCSKLIDDVASMTEDEKKSLDTGDPAKVKQHMKNTSGTTGWDQGPNKNEDALWCANHGVATDPSVMPTASPVPLTTDAAKSCNVTMVKGDKTCQETSDNIFRCQMANTQIIPQCMAYEAVTRAAGLQEVVLAIDIAATAACVSACVALSTPVVNVVASSITETACQGVGAAAGVSEMVSVFAMSSGPVQSIISGIGAAGGLGATAWGLSNAGDSGGWGIGTGGDPGALKTGVDGAKNAADTGTTAANDAQTAAQKAKEAAKVANDSAKGLADHAKDVAAHPEAVDSSYIEDEKDMAKMAKDRAKELDKDANELAKKADTLKNESGEVQKKAQDAKDVADKAKEQRDSQRNAACMAAAFFGVVTGLREWNLKTYQDKLAKDACKAVQDLASSAITPGGGAAAGAGNSNGGYAGPTGNGSGSGPNANGGNTGSGNGTDNGSGSGQNGCITPNCSTPQSQHATADGSALVRSGLDQALGPKTAEIADLLKKGITPGQIIQGAVGGQAGAAFGALATSAQEHASDLAGAVNLGPMMSAYSGGGGSGGGGGRSSDSGNPFASLFGGGAKNGAGRGPATELFGAKKPSDIWHTGTSMNLFEIVSQKVSTITHRVGL